MQLLRFQANWIHAEHGQAETAADGPEGHAKQVSATSQHAPVSSAASAMTGCTASARNHSHSRSSLPMCAAQDVGYPPVANG